MLDCSCCNIQLANSLHLSPRSDVKLYDTKLFHK